MEEVKFTGTPTEIRAKVSFMLLPEGEYDLTITPHRRKRSLNANAYLWALVSKIADRVRLDKEAVYRRMLEDYGQFEVIEMRSDIDPSRWFKYTMPIGMVRHDGVEYYQFKAYRGSSEYDTYEMSVLLDGVVNEATNLGIPTITEEELKRMKGAWGQ